MIVVPVQCSDCSYEVLVGPGALDRTGTVLESLLRRPRVAIIADRSAYDLHGATLERSLADAGIAFTVIQVPPGEQSKNWQLAGRLLEQLAHERVERDEALVAFGGGVVGDIAGFVAGVYMRGVDYYQIPTTLLSQVDSSVGGKTGVDLAAGKNLAGVFVQPKAVIADTALLATLPQSELLSGLAEVAKTAILAGEQQMARLKRDSYSLLAGDIAVLSEVVAECVRFKASVVQADERETGPRESLNLGHTLAHAIEKVAGYGAIPHGLAVAAGLRFTAGLSVRLGLAPDHFAVRQVELLDALDLAPTLVDLDIDAVRYAMRSDKKVRAGEIRFIFATEPGKWVVVPVDDKTITEELNAFLAADIARHKSM